MATNQSGIAIVIKAFLPTGKTLDEQFAALSIVKQAHETGDYAALLKAAHDVGVKTEAKTRRVEEPTPAPVAADPDFADLPLAPVEEAAPEAYPEAEAYPIAAEDAAPEDQPLPFKSAKRK